MDSEPGSLITINRSEAYSLRSKTIDDDTHETAQLSTLPGEEIINEGSPGHFTAVLTNYRLIVQGHTHRPHLDVNNYDIPIGLVDIVEAPSGSCELVIYCKNGQICRLICENQTKCEQWHERIVQAIKPLAALSKLFAFRHSALCKDHGIHHDPEKLDWVNMEFERMKMKSAGWTVTDANNNYELCSSYPKLLIVPKYYTGDRLKKIAKFRKSGRLPAVVWRDQTSGCVLVRSSQPQVGVWNWREQEDEKLLEDILKTSIKGYHKRLLVFDLRHYTAALANKAARGGGYEYEDYYPNCEIQFKGLPNIHTVQKSFVSLRTLVHEGGSDSFYSMLEQSHWLDYVSQILHVTNQVVEAIAINSQPVLVHCSDGWDRTAQVISLAELLLDPYYRTIKGFQVLVEREWLAFGHKFAERCGQLNCGSSERSPVFQQWVECVLHVTRQFPTAFEFNEAFLVHLVLHCYSNLYGTILGNNVQQREKEELSVHTESLWRALSDKKYTNLLYNQLDKVIMPNDHVMCLVVWRELYSSLSHSFHDNSKPVSKQDQQDGDEIDDELQEDTSPATNIQYSTPFVMETIQQRVDELVNTTIPSVSSTSSQALINQLKKETTDHTSMDPAEDNLHQWEKVTVEDAERVKWVPDYAALNCHLCNSEFTLLNRKHHCRSCGYVFCATCSDYYCPVPHELLTGEHRVCKKCFERLYDPTTNDDT